MYIYIDTIGISCVPKKFRYRCSFLWCTLIYHVPQRHNTPTSSALIIPPFLQIAQCSISEVIERLNTFS